MKGLHQIWAVLLLWTSLLQSQDIQLVLNQSSRSDTLSVAAAHVDSIIAGRLSALSAQGYWDASVTLSTEGPFATIIQAHFDRGEPAELGYVHFSGLSQKDATYLEQEFKMGRTNLLSDQLPLAVRRITRLGYQIQGDALLSRDSKDDYHLNYVIQNHPELQAQGLVSFNQTGSADTLAWYGQINVNIPNFDGRGKSFDFSWERLKSNSESFNLGIQYPWILNLPLTGEFKFGREVIDGHYQVIQTNLGLGWDIDWFRSIYLSYEKNESIITHEGALRFPEWQGDQKRLLGFGYRQSNLNLLSHRGMSIKTMLFQEVNFEPAALMKFTLRSESEYKLWGHFYCSQRTTAHIQNQASSPSDPSTLIALGGVNSVRGYEEAFIRAPNIVSMQNTLHFTIGNQTQILAFYDIGLHNTDNNMNALSGYGMGIQLRSGRGPIRLILASHEGVKLSNSFFHIEYSGGISWIDQ